MNVYENGRRSFDSNANSSEKIYSKEVAPFFIQSFMHSQGDLQLQAKLFIWAVNQGYLAGLFISPQLPDYFINIVNPPVKHKISDVSKEGLELIWHLLSVSLNNTPYGQAPYNEDQILDKLRDHSDRETLVFNILMNVMQRDLKFQTDSRQGRFHPTADDGQDDPHASLLRRYSLLGKSAGLPVYQDLYKAFSAMIPHYRTRSYPFYQFTGKARQKDLLALLNELTDQWNVNHPGQTFFPE